MSFWMILMSSFTALYFILSVVFSLRKGEANKIFALFLFLFSINLFFNILNWTIGQELIFAYYLFGHLIPLSLYGPLFYFYLLTNNEKLEFGRKDILHLLPFLISTLLCTGVYLINPSKSVELLNSQTIFEYFDPIPFYSEILAFILLVYSLVISSIIINKFKKDNVDGVEMKISSLSFIIFAFSYATYFVLTNLSPFSTKYHFSLTLLMSLSILVTTYFAFKNSSIYKSQPSTEDVPFKKYKTTGLNSESSIELKALLLNIMKKERLYLNGELRLDDLALKLKVNRSQASQVINEHFDLSFFDFINEYRIQEAERLLINSQLTISEIAYRSGFNNKVSFYKSFKKFNKLKPLQFREKMLAKGKE